MFCQNCGNELPAGAVFCPKCGAKTGELETVVNQQNSVSDSENLKKSRFRILSKVALLLVVFGFFMPVACNQNGFQMADMGFKLGRSGSPAVISAIFLYILFFSALISIGFTIYTYVTEKKIKTVLDVPCLLVSIGAGIFAYLVFTENDIRIFEAMQSGGYSIIIGWVSSAGFLIADTIYSKNNNSEKLPRKELTEEEKRQRQIAREKQIKQLKKIGIGAGLVFVLAVVGVNTFNYIQLNKYKTLKIKKGTEVITAVTEIDRWYSYDLEKVIIPNSVTKIGENAFSGCKSLTSVTIPDSVTEIGLGAFYECKSLTNVTIPKGVTKIGESTFHHCESLTSVTIPDSVTEIGEWAFGDCKSLTNVTIPNSVTKIGEWAFSGCESLTSVTIPDSVTEIGLGAFGDCKSLTNVTIPKGVTKIGRSTFIGCESLTSVTIPDSVTEIGLGAFGGCKSLTNVTIPKGVTKIGRSTFIGCESLTSVTIPDSVTEIEELAFGDCKSLTNVTIHKGVTKIGKNTFSGCESLTSVTIPDSVTEIGEFAFDDCESLTNVIIPNSVTEIGEWAFAGCKSLTSVTIPKGVTKIGEGTFSRCESLTSVNYRGSKAQWERIRIDSRKNDSLKNAKINFSYTGK